MIASETEPVSAAHQRLKIATAELTSAYCGMTWNSIEAADGAGAGEPDPRAFGEHKYVVLTSAGVKAEAEPINHVCSDAGTAVGEWERAIAEYIGGRRGRIVWRWMPELVRNDDPSVGMVGWKVVCRLVFIPDPAAPAEAPPASKVIVMPGTIRSDLSTDVEIAAVLSGALERAGSFRHVVVIARRVDGEIDVASSTSNIDEVIGQVSRGLHWLVTSNQAPENDK